METNKTLSSGKVPIGIRTNKNKTKPRSISAQFHVRIKIAVKLCFTIITVIALCFSMILNDLCKEILGKFVAKFQELHVVVSRRALKFLC